MTIGLIRNSISKRRRHGSQHTREPPGSRGPGAASMRSNERNDHRREGLSHNHMHTGGRCGGGSKVASVWTMGCFRVSELASPRR